MNEELARLGGRGARRRRRWSGRRPSWSASGWTGSATVAGRADELCRYAVLFGDPQLALTAVDRVLDVTAEEVREVAAARLRPDNRAVLVYEPLTAEDAGERAADRRRPGRTASTERSGRSDGRSREHGIPPTAGRGAAEALGVPRARAWRLGNGLTVLRCHRPGQQVVAVEICLDVPLDAEPDGLDGIATIMVDALSQGAGQHTAEEFAAELERCGATLDANADYLGARVSLEVPVSRLAKALGLLAEALVAPAFADSEVERLVRNRLDEIPLELANPGRRAAKQLSRELFPASARLSRPRKGTEETVARIDAAGVRALVPGSGASSHGDRGHRGRPDRCRPRRGARRHARRMDRRCRRAAAHAGGHRRRHRPRGDRGPAWCGPDAAADRADRPGPARPGMAGPGARHVLPGRHAHLPAGPGSARGEGLYLRGAGLRQVLRSPAADGAAGASVLAISGSVDTASTVPRWMTCGRCCARSPRTA